MASKNTDTTSGIEKLRKMNSWFDMQSEYFNEQFQHISQLQLLYDYAVKNKLEFLDMDYLYSSNLDDKEREDALKFINKVKKQNSAK